MRAPLPQPPRSRRAGPAPAPGPLSRGERAKAAADVALAALMLIPALPAVLACAALVKLTSRGPAVYTQARVGRGGAVFTLYKLRTMYHDCEKLTGPRWSTPGDSRITPLGRVLRKLHLDELPQLLNVLRGEMSLVGPRPERPEIVKKLRDVVVGYDRRHAVRPGITGFAQVHLPPDTCVRSVRNKLVYDLFYIRNRSWRMELFLLFATGLKTLGLKRLYHRAPRVPTE
ncbi:sugar transferase [Gemmata obscuriglobus]|uniref:sugar transferase n=1 Tax=Gemmata obscuriglobus TaxID=114 RepID=UPI00016C556F|nr:sugar transferase [Gemmata obscuriglobus]